MSIVPPVATAEMNFNTKKSSYHGTKMLNKPVSDCTTTAIIKGILRPILKINDNQVFFNFAFFSIFMDFFFHHLDIADVPIGHHTEHHISDENSKHRARLCEICELCTIAH